MRVLLTFMLLCVVSIVEASPTPGWVLGKGHPSYDSSRYLIGVGFSEKSIVLASESARAELIKSISVRVNTVNKDYNSTDKSFSDASISSETDFLLEGSQIKDGWVDENNGIFYSLVVIKRQYVLDTLKEMINVIVAKNTLTLRQADTFLNNGDVLKALIYYYDGYIESSKLFPYIQTYKSVIIDTYKSVTNNNYNLLFKEKIQNIVDNIRIELIRRQVIDNDIRFSVKATLNGKGIDNFPIKFYSVYKTFSDRMFCKNTGCETRVGIVKIINDGGNTHLKAVVDMKTLEKYFTYNLDRNLFSRLSLLSVSVKSKTYAAKYEKPFVPKNVERKSYEYKDKPSQVRSDADEMANVMERELRGMRSRGNFGVRYCSADGRYNSCGSRGRINFNFRW